MNRQQKEQTVASLRESFKQSQGSFLITYQGMSVVQLQVLRKELRDKGGSLKVSKARLMKRAVEGLDACGELAPFFKEQVGLVFAPQESPAVAKVLHEFSKTNEALKLVVGCLDARVFDADALVLIAQLPSREVLLAQVCGTMSAPISAYVRVLNQLVVRLLYVLNRIAEKKQ